MQAEPLAKYNLFIILQPVQLPMAICTQDITFSDLPLNDSLILLVEGSSHMCMNLKFLPL